VHNWTIRRKHGHGTALASSNEEEIATDSSGQGETSTLLAAKNNHPNHLARQLTVKSHNKMFYTSTRTPVEHGDLKIFPNCAHVMLFAGLRGAVAYACARRFPDVYGHRDAFTMTTMIIILTTIFVFGGITPFILNLFDIETDVCEDAYMSSWPMDHSLPKFVDMAEKLIVQLVRRVPDEDGDNAVSGSSQSHQVSSKVRRRSTVSVTTSIRFESQGMYDFGME
jgi:hypothetical protein